MVPRPAFVHPSGLSPTEHETYTEWIDELDSHINTLGRGLRFGELTAFIRKRTPVDREAEIMSFFGSVPEQQSLGTGEFVAVLRLLAHARTCSTLTRDHIFIQTHPLVVTPGTTGVSSDSHNPFLHSSRSNSTSRRLDNDQSVDLRKVAAKKKRVLPPLIANVPSPNQKAIMTSAAPKASSTNPFCKHPTHVSPAENPRTSEDLPQNSLKILSTSTDASKLPPLPPRPAPIPKRPPPKHVSQSYTRLDDGTQTPTHIKPLHVPALGPTSLDIILSSMQREHTGTSAESTGGRLTGRQAAKPGQGMNEGSRRLGDNAVRLLGSSHIGVDNQPLRAEPSHKHSFSSEEFYLQRNRSSSSSCSVTGISPNKGQDCTPSLGITSMFDMANSRDLHGLPHTEDEENDTICDRSPVTTTGPDGQTKLKGLVVKDRPMPPPVRRRPDSLAASVSSKPMSQRLVFGSTPVTSHPGPYSATSIRSSPFQQRTNSIPYISHGKAASVSGSIDSQTYSGPRPLHKGAQGLARATSTSHKHTPLDAFLSKGRNVSQEWLEKAKAGMLTASREDCQGLITSDEVAFNAKAAAEDGNGSDNSESMEADGTTVADRRRELEKLRIGEEAGWARLN